MCAVVCRGLAWRRQSAPTVFSFPSSNGRGIVISIPVRHLVLFLYLDSILIVFVVGVIVKSFIDGAQQHLPNATISRSVVNYVPVNYISERLGSQHHSRMLSAELWTWEQAEHGGSRGEHVQVKFEP